MNTPLQPKAFPFLRRSFAAFFATQFCGALNDNVYRNTISTMLTFGFLAANLDEANKAIFLHLAVGLFILGLLLFSASGGMIADHFSKRRLIIVIKFAEILLALLAGLAFATASIPLMMITLFLMGSQSAFFGPIKYSYLPEILPQERELVLGNGFVSGSTHISILLGVLLGTHLGGQPLEEGSNPAVSSFFWILIIALAGFGASLLIPRPSLTTKPDSTGIMPFRITAALNFPGSTWRLIRYRENVNAPALTAILGISWFWLVGALFLTLLPLFVESIGYPVEIYKALLLLTCVSVAAGALSISLVVARLGLRIAPVSCTFALAGLAFSLVHFGSIGGFKGLLPENDTGAVSSFLAEGMPAFWTIFDIAAISFFEGLLIVPLITKMQTSVDERCRASVVATNNVYNSLLIVLGALASTALTSTVLDSFKSIYSVLGASTILFAIFLLRRLKREQAAVSG